MFVRTGLPTYDIAGLLVRPGDILGRTKPGSIIEHRALIAFDGAIGHSSGPGDVFRPGALQEVLKDGGVIRVVYPTRSLEETEWRFVRANQIIGVPWWTMNCHTTTDFIAGVLPTVRLM
jgi:hypothetical protein